MPNPVVRFARLEHALQKLNRLATRCTEEQYRRQDDLQDIVERNFQIAIEAIVDLANHLISTRGYRQPRSNVDVFVVLAEEGIIDQSFAQNMGDWVRFHNLLVHDYAMIDPGQVYRILSTEVGDLKKVAQVLAKELDL